MCNIKGSFQTEVTRQPSHIKIGRIGRLVLKTASEGNNSTCNNVKGTPWKSSFVVQPMQCMNTHLILVNSKDLQDTQDFYPAYICSAFLTWNYSGYLSIENQILWQSTHVYLYLFFISILENSFNFDRHLCYKAEYGICSAKEFYKCKQE